jgi:hypothetical protein
LQPGFAKRTPQSSVETPDSPGFPFPDGGMNKAEFHLEHLPPLMKKTLAGKKVAILVTDGFEQVELTKPREALQEAGATALIVSPKGGEVQGWDTDDFGDSFEADLKLKDARVEDFDALLLPGGVMNPDTLRTIPEAVKSSMTSSPPASRWPRFATGPRC